MIENFESKLNEYADLLIKIGLNVQKGQLINIRSSVESADFARLCVKKAYEAGCSDIIIDWRDDFTDRQRYLYADDSVFDSFPQWKTEQLDYIASNKGAVLSIYATDPEALNAVDPDRISRYSKAKGNGMKNFYAAQMANEFPWCIGSVPIPSWAKKVFPDLSESDAMEALWNAIFKTVRISGDGSSIKL